MRAVIAVLLMTLAGLAQAVETGTRLAPWTLLDQYDQPYTLDNGLQLLLVARDMDGAKLVKAALEGKPKGYLEARKAVFLADVSRMPAIISTLFAVPAMRDYSYRVLLDRESRVTPRYSAEPGSVLLLRLDQGVVVESLQFIDSDALQAILESSAE
ncbi:FAD/FMN-containing dehydrogenase [Pseudomonas sp. PDM13]|uniref:FAD/FMN-containing dehydrogenase n=1 Tax=Pseudomonas sp. PDM13 TaxID=2769255 RepID=UPI0021DF8D14|nr:FAD/FMN-containing dehydrogenase [Pseudomonas sp. PDM13]MCU9946778.1 FAD/FMN-containing dehydrogenase [Pseudomonas sp. PDM13]